MAPEFDEGFKDIFKTWCGACQRYVNPWMDHTCHPPGTDSEAKLENWLGEYELD